MERTITSDCQSERALAERAYSRYTWETLQGQSCGPLYSWMSKHGYTPHQLMDYIYRYITPPRADVERTEEPDMLTEEELALLESTTDMGI